MPRHTLWRPYAQMKIAAPPIEVVATSGTRIKCADGRLLVDGMASWWTACHGYNHPHIAACVREQLARMPHVMFGGFTHAPAEKLGARLAAMLPGDLDHVFFTDSGSVAVEVAMKMAVQYWHNRGDVGRTRFVSFRDGYHGDTMGAMSVTDPEEGMHHRLGAYLPKQIVIDLPRDAATRAGLDEALARIDVAAAIVEPLVQGAGGMKMHSPDVLREISVACRRHDRLLIVDEIMTGFGRTGSMFAVDEAGIVPDIMCLSKALTGGTLALAATIARTHVFDAFWSDDPATALMHGPTFMANPLACAAANASLDIFENEPRLEQVARIAERLAAGLDRARGRPGVADVRVKGAIGVIELLPPIDLALLRVKLIEHGVWVRPFGSIVYLTPAFVIDDAGLDQLIEAVVDVATTRCWSETGPPSRRTPPADSLPS